MTAKLLGILTDVFPVETKPNFSKKVFWLKQPDTERNPQHWELELHTADIDQLKGIKVGDVLECEVEIRGRKFKRRDGGEGIFTSLKCVGLRVLDKLQVPGFKAKPKPGRESDDDRYEPQGTLPL
jgi:hypothetical protein